jgi:FkbM family methyltransferase
MGSLVRALRRVAAKPVLAHALRWPPLERIVATILRSTTVRRSALFAARELAGRRGLDAYQLQGSGRTVFLRHGTPDIVTLDEVFYRRDYEFPAAVAAVLHHLDRQPVALDLGANVGFFGVFFLERFGRARVIAIEADEGNVEVLRRCAEVNGGSRQWEIVAAAADTSQGTTRFVSGEYSLSRIADEGEAIPAIDVFPYFDQADLVKIDIEGAEWPILADPRLADTPVSAIVIEYHPYRSPESDPRALAARALEAAGFEVLPLHHYEHGHGMLWGLRSCS